MTANLSVSRSYARVREASNCSVGRTTEIYAFNFSSVFYVFRRQTITARASSPHTVPFHGCESEAPSSRTIEVHKHGEVTVNECSLVHVAL
jgi:hypothetical protein